MTATALDERTALVLIDLQKGVIAAPAIHPMEGVIANAARLADAFRARDLPVVLVRVSFSADGGDMPKGRTDSGGFGGGQTLPDGWDEIVDEVQRPGDIVVTKRQWGAFHGTDLDLQLRRRGVTGVVLSGVSTSIGVDTTARAAYEHGYNVTVATDAVTDRDADAHRHSMETIFPKLGETDTTDALLKLLAAR